MGFHRCRQRQFGHGAGGVGNIAGECFQEGNDVVGVFLRQVFAQLRFTHNSNGFVQFPNAAVVEIWISFGDVTQTWDAEEEFVFGFFGDVGTTFVLFRIFNEFPVRTLNQTEFLESCAAEVDAAVAGDTAVVHKGAHAFALLFVQGVDVAFEVVVPFGRRQQGAFECAQCGGNRPLAKVS